MRQSVISCSSDRAAFRMATHRSLIQPTGSHTRIPKCGTKCLSRQSRKVRRGRHHCKRSATGSRTDPDSGSTNRSKMRDRRVGQCFRNGISRQSGVSRSQLVGEYWHVYIPFILDPARKKPDAAMSKWISMGLHQENGCFNLRGIHG